MATTYNSCNAVFSMGSGLAKTDYTKALRIYRANYGHIGRFLRFLQVF